VTVNAICPGLCATEKLLAVSHDRGARLGMTGEQLLETFAQKTALKRLITVEEVAAAALFLVSPQASGITGVQLSVDGGQSPF
jgi:3-hydroxybutyrate dehydrogenase